ARHGARRRRHVHPRRARAVRSAEPGRQAAARGSSSAARTELIRYHASWVVPISGPPISDAWIAIDRGRIVALGQRSATDTAPHVELGDVAVLPGLVNAHTHLELSYLRDEVPPAPEFVMWIRRVMAARRQRPDPRSREILSALDSAIAE